MRIALLAASLSGCALMRPLPVADNPANIANSNYEKVWTDVVVVVEKYFDIAYENRYDGRIETKPVVGATCLEPWRLDTIGCYQRFESSLQTIRRRGFILLTPAPAGGFQIVVEVYKEIEDLPRPIGTQFGGGSFITSIQPIREEVVTSPVEPGLGWISLGRDKVLESQIIQEIQQCADNVSAVDEIEVRSE